MLPPHLMAAAAASWNLENYNLLMRSSQTTNRSLAGVPLEITKPKPNHLWQLFTRYEEFLSEKARNYLKIDFSLDQKLYQEPDTIQNEQIRDAIKRGISLNHITCSIKYGPYHMNHITWSKIVELEGHSS